ncbi:MAG: NADP-dependent isocitrate dehydrogenase [Bacteroidota bacterium]
MAESKKRITVAYGDGIGPEIMQATLDILEAANAPLAYDVIEIGESVYKQGATSGIERSSWDTLRRNRVFLKAPITTPQGGGYKSLNVTIRKTLGLFANVRECKSYSPFVSSPYPGMDLVIIRENEEDLYAGIEHQQTPEVYQALKLLTRPGTEAIVRYAFEYAHAHSRRKVTCMTKDNIMKHTDGMFHKTFDRIAKEYPQIKADHQIIDIGAARVAAQPNTLDVVVTLNLYGDILSDIAAQVAGSVGLAGSANIGNDFAMFEAIHGSAPDIAGKEIANPSGLLNAAIQMLVHVGEPDVATRIKNAWLCTLEDGIHTPDIFRQGLSSTGAGTRSFTEAVIERLGKQPEQLKEASYQTSRSEGIVVQPSSTASMQKELVGVDVFIDWSRARRDPDVIGQRLVEASTEALRLKMITNRGVKVYPDGLPETYCTDHWRCRFTSQQDATSFADILALLQCIYDAEFDVIKTEHLYTFNGERGYSLGQGE